MAYIVFASILTIRTGDLGVEMLIGVPRASTLPDLGPSLLAGFPADQGRYLQNWLLFLEEQDRKTQSTGANKEHPSPPPGVSGSDKTIKSRLVEAPVRVQLDNSKHSLHNIAQSAVEQRRTVILRLDRPYNWRLRHFTLVDIELAQDR